MPLLCAWQQGIGTARYIRHSGPRRPSTSSQRLSQTAPGPPRILPLAKHSLDRVVHLGVLVVLGRHQELLNIPKKAT